MVSSPLVLPIVDRPPACQWGPSGRCAMGAHDECAHQPGRAHEHGHWAPTTYLTDRRGYVDERCPEVGPWHRWRCSCACHRLVAPATHPVVEGVQLALLG